MKKSILYIIFMGLQGLLYAQVNTMNVYNSCITAAKVCGNKKLVTTSSPSQAECLGALQPQFFKVLTIASGNIELNTHAHTGTYTLFGPMTSEGITSCQQISLGQVNQVSGSLSGTINIPHDVGYYILMLNLTNCVGSGDNYHVDIDLTVRQVNCKLGLPCKDCISSFSPDPGKYLISAWVKGESQHKNASYLNPGIAVSFVGVPDSSYFIPSGPIIDDWQRIDEVVTVPLGATAINIGLYCQSGDCLFDDIRFIPLEGSMISYVYDPINLKLVAQLDERNFAVFYEYNEEGKLVRIKKETEKGIMTVQETRDNTRKK